MIVRLVLHCDKGKETCPKRRRSVVHPGERKNDGHHVGIYLSK